MVIRAGRAAAGDVSVEASISTGVARVGLHGGVQNADARHSVALLVALRDVGGPGSTAVAAMVQAE